MCRAGRSFLGTPGFGGGPLLGESRGPLGIDVPLDWAAAGRQMLEGSARRVAVLGPVDAGKSSFCRWLLVEAAAASRPVALLDADPAQKTVGPPACVTLGLPGPGGVPVLAGLAFVGAVDPLRGWARLMAGVARLAAEAPASLVLANTSGLLRGAGRRLKAAKLRALQADLILAIGADPGLDAVLGDHRDLPTLRLGVSPHARRKTGGERRAARRMAFSTYLSGARSWTMRPDQLWTEESPGALTPHPDRVVLGLAGADGRDLALGILTHGEPDGTMHIAAPLTSTPIAGLRLGLLTLDAKFGDQPVRR